MLIHNKDDAEFVTMNSHVYWDTLQINILMKYTYLSNLLFTKCIVMSKSYLTNDGANAYIIIAERIQVMEFMFIETLCLLFPYLPVSSLGTYQRYIWTFYGSIFGLIRNWVKGSDRQFMVVELRLQHCMKSFQDSFETYQTFPLCIITEFERKVDVKNHPFGQLGFENRFFKNYQITVAKNVTTILRLPNQLFRKRLRK